MPHTPAELEAKFWKALKSDMTIMLGLEGGKDATLRPMTAQLDGDEGGPIWFFTAKDTELVRELRGRATARSLPSPRRATISLPLSTASSRSTTIAP